jgi:hypothetical protein
MAPSTPTKKATTPGKKASEFAKAATTKKASTKKAASERATPDRINSEDEAEEANTPAPATPATPKRARSDDEETTEEKKAPSKKARVIPEIDLADLAKQTKDPVIRATVNNVLTEEEVIEKVLPSVMKAYFKEVVNYDIPAGASETVEKRFNKLNADNEKRFKLRVENEEKSETFDEENPQLIKIESLVRRLVLGHLSNLESIGNLKLSYETTTKNKEGKTITVTKPGLQITHNAVEGITKHVSTIMLELLHGAKQVMANRGVSVMDVKDVETALNVAFPLKQKINYAEDLTKRSGIVNPNKNVFQISNEFKKDRENRIKRKRSILQDDAETRKAEKLYLSEAHLNYLASKAVSVE